ncbi:hypothetical protein DH2020_035889 [Rehmannia glutinosa]|uniref:Inosine/uridine-preferring nucleoside hydrolase domain-containing protein n=1 Tax=Rehmannia glutinosa TaxID=99300 RepID=A0ABR0V823_REHGL
MQKPLVLLARWTYIVNVYDAITGLMQAVTINTNAWTNAGHAVNQVYDILYMMGRDDIAVGVGGEGGILEDGTILPNVGGYLPIIEQGNDTAGYCRYRQAIPVGLRGKLDIDTNYGFRKSFLPQGSRRYSPLRQPTAQEVMIDKISAGPITVFIIGANTNSAIFLMSNPHLKNNIKHIYIMGGGVRSRNPTGCCPKNSSRSCQPRQCGDSGNIYTGYLSNPYAESNMFGDPFAAYQSYFMWDSFLSGVATSIMLRQNNSNGDNEFAEMEYMNITVITSNEPYGISDGSNPFFYGLKKPKFNLKRNGVHSGHVQTGLQDPFCIVKNGKGRCKDGYTAEVSGREGVRVLVAVRAKRNRDKNSSLNREYFRSFLDVLNRQEQTGKFNLTTQFPHYRQVIYTPDFKGRKLGKNVVFDMDMSAGDFLALFYLLKVPVEVINLKAILVTPTGWANAATIDVIYDLLHMMGVDDIPVGLGGVFALNQSDPIFAAVGDCKYNKAIPQGSGGFLDSDTLYGLARDLPSKPSEDIFIVGGLISNQKTDKGNVIDIIPSNEYAELNFFLDPLAAKTVFDSSHNITLIPLNIQRRVCQFKKVLESLHLTRKTPEALFARRLLSRLHRLKMTHHRYQHVDIFLGEILGAVILAGNNSFLKTTYAANNVEVLATGVESEDGRIIIDKKRGSYVKVLENVDPMACYDTFANQLGDEKQSAVIGSFEEQRRIWSGPHK